MATQDTKCRKITLEEQQQEFSSYFGFQSEIIWDEYDSDINSDAKSLLLRKINLIFGDEIDETIESDGITVNELSIQLKKSSKEERLRKMKENLVEAIWNQRKYNKGKLLMSPIFVALIADSEQYANDLTRCKHSLNYSLHPVFRIIKCRKNEISHKCCMVFVDEHARVYQNWIEFKTHNEYPPGYLVAPTLGVYNTVDVIDSNNLNRVPLDIFVQDSSTLRGRFKCNIQHTTGFYSIFPTPSNKSSSKFAAKADKISTVGGLAAAGVTAATIVSIPMLPIVAAGALLTGISCAAYTAGRSAFKLADRSKHEQTIKFTDTKARSHWLGFASGAFGAGLAGGAAVSKVGQVVTGSASTILNGTAMLMNGVSTLNGIYAIFLKKHDYENISSLEMDQFRSSLFIFTHSVYNFQTVDNIARSSRKTTIGEYRRALSHSQQIAFEKLVEDTNHQKGLRADIIRSLLNIKDTKEFFGYAYSDGEIRFNDAQATNSVSNEDNLANLLEIPEVYPAAVMMHLNDNKMIMSSAIPHDHVIVAVKDLIELGIFVRHNKDFESLMIELAEQVNNNVFDIVIDFMRSYFNENCRNISEILNDRVPFECVFEAAMNIIRDSAKSSGVDIGENIENIDSKYLRSQINVFYNRQRIRHELRGRPTEHCKICFGTYYVDKNDTV